MADHPARIHPWQPAAVLAVEGPDALTFLQAQFTNDLRNAGPGDAVYGLWLDRKGHVQADSFVVRDELPNRFIVCSYHSPAATIRAHLESHLIADEVTVVDETEGWFGATFLGGSEKPAALISFSGRRGIVGAVELLGRSPFAMGGSTELTANEMERARIAAGTPRVPADIGPGELPNEGGLEVDAISYTKGCYLGQEVIARLKSMGRVRRMLLRVEGSGTPPAPGTKVFQAGRAIGETRTAVAVGADRFEALALLSLPNLNRAEAVEIRSAAARIA